MKQTRKLNILVADDQPGDVKIVKDILDAEGSILKNHFNLSIAYFVESIPKDDESLYNETYVATHIISNADFLDLALIDVVFQDEFNSTSSEGAEIIIEQIKQKFPHCPIGLLSNNAGGIFLDQTLLLDNNKYPVLGKRPNQITTTTYNVFFKKLLNNWLRIKLSQIDREDKVDELLGLLANPQKTLESTLSFGEETWLLSDLFFFISKQDKEPIRQIIIEYLVQMPRLRQLKNPARNLVFYKNTTNEWSISFSDLFNSYYSFLSFQPQNSFTKLATEAENFIKELHQRLCISNKKEPKLDGLLSPVIKMSRTSIRNQLLSKKGTIPHAVVPLFKDKLIKRMITLDLYCLLGFSGTGINFLLNQNNDALHDNHTKGISKYLGINLPDQISTKVDLLVHSFQEADRRRRSRKANLASLDRFRRQYDFQFNYCGSYEKKQLISMSTYLTNETCNDSNCTICRITKGNLKFISDNNML